MTIVKSHLPCPTCGSSDALTEYEDGHTYCFSCQTHTPAEGAYLDEHQSFTYEYVPLRGISKSTLESFGTRTKVGHTGKPISIGFRYPNGDVKVRRLDKKEFFWKKNGSSDPIGLFGQDKFTPGGHKYVTITEGELDALSLYQVLGGPVVSVSSASSARRDCINSRSWLSAYDRIYLCFDNDAVGRDATAAVARLFDRDKVYDVRLTHRKDANEYLQAGEADQLKHIWWNAKKYLPENIKSSLADFKRAMTNPPQWGVSYPFKRLTEMTYGIRRSELVLITAQEKVGKTEFMHSILYNLLKEQPNDTNVGCIFAEESAQRTLQALAGIHLGRPVHLPDAGVAQDQVIEAVDQVVRVDDRLHLCTHTGSSDPEVVLDTLRFLAAACSCQYILWDHPGMDVFGMGTDNERQTLDYLASKSEQLVRELDFGLIVVCHVNDLGQIRGSRYFGKTCDLRIDLVRDTGNPNEDIRNTVTVTIPYGRFSSHSGPVGSFRFDPAKQSYTEVANDNDPNADPFYKAA